MNGRIQFAFVRDLRDTRDSKGSKCDGFACTAYDVVVIDADLPPKDMLETAVHEAVHCMFPKATEQVVERTSFEIADMLWRMGYRKV